MANPDGYDIIIEAGRSELHYWKDLWRYRELFFFLSWKELLVRYKQTVMGVMWSVIRPVLTMIVFTVVFGKIAKLPSSGVPYPILVFCAMLPWQYFANSFSEASVSLIANTNLVSKIYFPRIIIPSSTIMMSLVDLMISILVLAAIMAWYSFIPTWKVFLLPLFLLLDIILSLGAGFIVSALNVKYRDFKHVVPFIIQFGLYVSPVGYNSAIFTEKWRLIYSLNPMVGIIDGFRWCITGDDVFLYAPALAISIAVSLMLLVIGLVYFRRVEKTFADVI
ncbi:MAG TPA: ABC transporter permease [Spirochaetota bacterium]|nr:ABC transporter permease [Spirochaetota bacterium]